MGPPPAAGPGAAFKTLAYAAGAEYGAAYRGGGVIGAADIAPRISHFDYMKHYAPPPAAGGPGAAIKTLAYAAGAEYGAQVQAPPHGQYPPPPHMRRYLAPNLAQQEQQHGGIPAPPQGGGGHQQPSA